MIPLELLKTEQSKEGTHGDRVADLQEETCPGARGHPRDSELVNLQQVAEFARGSFHLAPREVAELQVDCGF